MILPEPQAGVCHSTFRSTTVTGHTYHLPARSPWYLLSLPKPSFVARTVCCHPVGVRPSLLYLRFSGCILLFIEWRARVAFVFVLGRSSAV